MFDLHWKRVLLLILALLLVIIVSYPGMFAHFHSRIPKDFMDTEEQLASINWQNHFIFREPGLVFNLGTFYPHALATFFGPPIFGIAAFYGVFKLFGLNMYAQYNIFTVLALMIGALGVFALTLEASGKDKWIAFIASVTYIVFNTHRALYIWPAIFSAFFVPWALVFFLRFLRNLRHRDLLLFMACAALQVSVSEYGGVYLLVFFLPWLILFALLFKALSLKSFLKIAAGMALTALLLLSLYHPIITSFDGVMGGRVYRPEMLLNISDLFTTNHSFLYSQVLKIYLPTLFNWFPGMVVTILFFISGMAWKRSWSWPWVAFTASGLLGVLMLQKANVFLATVLYLLLLASFAAGHFRQRRRNLPLTLLALAFVGYLLLFFNLLPLGLPPQAFPFSILASLVPYFQNMCEYKRVFVILVPVMAVLAAHGLRQLDCRRRWLPFLVLALIWFENFEPSIRDWGHQLGSENRAPIYAAIPRESDKVILEIPFFGGTEVLSIPAFFQSIYSYSTRFHWNFVVNGRNSFVPIDQPELASHAAIPAVLARENIAWLKRHYAVEYLVINWPFLKPEEALQVRERIPFLAEMGDTILEIPQATVIRLRERNEITVLERRYSAYHLRHRQLLLKLARPYSLCARVAVGIRHWREFQLHHSSELSFRVDPKLVQSDCAMVTISFSQPVHVAEISLRKE